MMIGCGHNATTGWRPTNWVHLHGFEVANLTIDNLDEDHVSDLPNLYRLGIIRSLSTNRNITPDWLRRAKAAQGMGPGIATAIAMMEQYTGGPYQSTWGGMQIARFGHPTSRFDDVNSLSLVTFVNYGGVRMVFPGDLTRAAWRDFLADPDFLSWLRVCNIFLASHHGREDGYCPDVFKFCTPEVIIISDDSIQYATQDVDYRPHAAGIRCPDGSTRWVLTTRNDGALTIEEQHGTFCIWPMR
jgi:beta-lactamase superfamily II metal-dependent hydrolase